MSDERNNNSNRTKAVLVLAGFAVLLVVTLTNALRSPAELPSIPEPRQRVSERESAQPVSGDPLATVLSQLRGGRPPVPEQAVYDPTPMNVPPTPTGPIRYGLSGVDHTVSAGPPPSASFPPASAGPAFSSPAGSPDFLSLALDRLERAGTLPAIGQPDTSPDPVSDDASASTAYKGFKPAPTEPALIAGTVMTARVDVATHSDYASGMWRGLVTRNVMDITGTHVLVPAGSRLLGRPFAAASQNQILNERLGLGVTLIVRPDGSEIHLPGGVALDDQGVPAIGGDVNKHLWKRVGGFAAYALLGVAPGLLLENGEARSSQDRALRDLTTSTTRAAQSFVQPYLSLVPTIRVPAGTAIHIVFTQSIEVPPYG